MGTILQFMFSENDVSYLPEYETDEDMFFETTFLGLLAVTVPSRIGVLLDLRSSICYDEDVNTGILLLNEPRSMSIIQPQKSIIAQSRGYGAIWIVGGHTVVSIGTDQIQFELGPMIAEDPPLVINAKSLDFVAGYVEGIGENAKPIVAHEYDDYLSTAPTWASKIRLLNHNCLADKTK